MTEKNRRSQPEKADKAPKKTRKKSRLNPRQVKLLKGLAQGKSVKRAAIEAGYSPNTAQHPSDVLDTKAMREALVKLLAPVEQIAETINAGLEAIETEIFCNVVGSKLKGTEEIKLTHVDKIAWSERRQYAALAARLKGLMPGEEIDVSGTVAQNVTVRFTNVSALQEA